MKLLLKQIYNECHSNIFLWIELLVVFVVFWYVVDLLYVTARVYFQPMGFDIENTYTLRLKTLTNKAVEYNPDLTVEDDMIALKEIVDRLSRRPGVESVCISQNCVPYNDGSNGARFYFPQNDSVSIHSLQRWSTPEYYKVFGFRNIDGTGSESLVKALSGKTIILPVDIAEQTPKLPFKRRDLLGKEVSLSANGYQKDARLRIAALTEPVRYDHFTPAGRTWRGTYIGTFLSEEHYKIIGNVSYLEISLRVRKDEPEGFIDRLMDDADRLYQVGNVYILSVLPMSDVRMAREVDNENELRTQLCILFFLMLNIFLGVIGTFWFRTQRRRSEIALRMALGANRKIVFRNLFTEGILLLSLAALPAILITFNAGCTDLVDDSRLAFTASRFLTTILLTYALMAGMIVAGILYPALETLRIQPAEALRDE